MLIDVPRTFSFTQAQLSEIQSTFDQVFCFLIANFKLGEQKIF